MKTIGFNGKTVAELTKLAKAVIHKNWRYEAPEDGGYGEPPVSPPMVVVTVPPHTFVEGFEYQLTHNHIDIADAEYIAAFNPKTVLEMLKTLKEKEKQIAYALELLDSWRDDYPDVDPITMRAVLRIALEGNNAV